MLQQYVHKGKKHSSVIFAMLFLDEIVMLPLLETWKYMLEAEYS